MRGLAKFVSSVTRNPLAAIGKSIMFITVPTILLFLLNHDNDDWKNITRYTKDNYFLIPIGSYEDGRTRFLKIAKPREWGVIYSDTIERGLQYFADNDPKAFKEFKQAWFTNFTPSVRSVMAPFNDVRANKDFVDRPIVPGYLQNLSPELQYDETNSQFAIGLGDALNMSPKQIDYLIKSYTGFIGQVALPAISQGRGQSGTERALEGPKRSFILDPLYSNNTLNDFYEIKDKLDKARQDSIATNKRSPDLNEPARKAFASAATKIGDINKEIRQINANPNLSYEEKTKRVERLRAMMLEYAQAHVDAYDKINVSK